MHTEVITDDGITSQPYRGMNTNLQSVSEDQTDLSQPAPQYSELESHETMAKQVLANQEKASSETGVQLNASSPQESLTSATLSSFPLTTESQLPESFNSQEQIGNEIFDLDTCVSSSIDTTADNASVSTTALLHVDYDNHAMLDSNNDLYIDENKVLLAQARPRQKVTNSVVKTKHNKRAPPPPEYKVVMKHSGRFHVHEPAR